MKRWAIVMMVLLAFAHVQIEAHLDKNKPKWLLWGNPAGHTWIQEEGIWINDNMKNEGWLVAGPKNEQYYKLIQPQRVPVKTTYSVSFDYQTYLKPETGQYHVAIVALTSVPASKKRFVLINVEQTDDFEEIYRIWPHLGILSIGTVAEEESWDVVLWDELIQGHVDLAKIVEPGDVVGFSLIVSGIKRGAELAREAKHLGAHYVIAGNDAAIFRAKQLLQLPNRPIDAVFTSNSTESVRAFLQGIVHTGLDQLVIPEMATSPATAIRHSNESHVLSIELADRKRQRQEGMFNAMDGFVIPNLDLFAPDYWEVVWTAYRNQYGHKHPNPDDVRGGLIHFAQGCTRTQGKEACSYCTIAGVADVRIPDETHIRALIDRFERFGINNLYNVTDSAFEMRPLVQRLRRVGFTTDALEIYGRAQGIATNPDLIEAWVSFANDRLLINCGMDSGDDAMLSRGVIKSSSTKGSRLSENRKAILNLRGTGAHLLYSLIFGSPGETIESCERTLEFISWTGQQLGQQLDVVETDIYWLNFGSPASRVFHDYDYAKSLAALAGKTIDRTTWQNEFARHSDALVVPWSAQEAWYHHFTQIEVAVGHEYVKKAAAIMRGHRGAIQPREYAFKPPTDV